MTWFPSLGFQAKSSFNCYLWLLFLFGLLYNIVICNNSDRFTHRSLGRRIC